MGETTLEPYLRHGRTEDIPVVRRLLDDCGLPYVDIEDQFSEAFFVAESEGVLIGVAGIERYGDCGLLRSVAVAEACRGRGVGAHLVQECLDRARSRGIADIYLLTLDAQKYFESLGFAAINRDQVPAEVAKSSEFQSVCPASATVMVLRSDAKAGR